MSAPQGAYTKLAWHEEATWGAGQRSDFTAALGYRTYFDSCAPVLRKDPVRQQEIRGVNAVDYADFVEGPIGVRLTLAFRMRYSGLHAALMAYALGSLATSGVGPYTHRADLADDLPYLVFMYGPPDTTNTVFDNWLFTGMMCDRMTISHQQGQPILVTQEWLGKTWDFDNNSSQTFPDPVTNTPLGPHEDYVMWHDLTTGTLIQVDPDSASFAAITCQSWEITISNNLIQRFVLADSRQGPQPQRQGYRNITGRVTCDKDNAWEVLATAFGITGATDSDPFDFKASYDGGGNLAAFFRANNCRVTSIPPEVADPGPLVETIEFEAHVDDAGSGDDQYPFWFDVDNDEESPGGSNPATWGATV